MMGDPFGIDDIYIALITPAIVMLIEWLVWGSAPKRQVAQS
jgi:solute:Na+ symporter, SSS family